MEGVFDEQCGSVLSFTAAALPCEMHASRIQR